MSLRVEILSIAKVRALQPRKVYEQFTKVRALISSFYTWHNSCGDRSCEICLGHAKRDTVSLETYQDILRAELKLRPYVKLTKKQKALQRQEKLSNLKGNRRQRCTM